MQVETVAMFLALLLACVRLHGLYAEPAAVQSVSPVWPIAFIVTDGFMFISVAALAITQASQVRGWNVARIFV